MPDACLKRVTSKRTRHDPEKCEAVFGQDHARGKGSIAMYIARRGLAALAISLALSASAFAQGWPNKPIRMIVPYTPGGYTDLMARTVGQKLSEALGVPFIFENKPGANAIIGTDTVAKAAPDGYTFGTVIAAHAVNATLNPKLPYDTLKD